FDLGLSLFKIGEQFGRRFGEEEVEAGVSGDTRDQRHAQVECARRLVEIVGRSPATSPELRPRARYLEGNLAFLDGAYEDAVQAYDQALVLAPGMADGGDGVGRDAAYNRAIALRRIEDRKDAGSDASSNDGGHDGSSPGDSGTPPKDAGGGGPDGSNGGKDAGKDSESPQQDHPDAAPPEPPPDAGTPPPPTSANEDERMLDQLESAPTLQQEEAKRAGRKRVRGMADK
ncbi:MAG: tetratricopeptide repeat protein, partial [Polyangiaceae bacterium]